MLVATYNVAAPNNVAVLDRILRVRADIAGLLGYRNWAAYDTQVRMAGDEKTVSAFIDRVVAAARPRATRELAELARRKAQDRPGSALHPWDRLYYSELVRRSSYDFDSQVVRPYFAFERVLGGVLRVTGTIFGLTYRQVADVPVWHPSVRVYEMRDGEHPRGPAVSGPASPREQDLERCDDAHGAAPDAKVGRSRRSCCRRACPGISRTIPG